LVIIIIIFGIIFLGLVAMYYLNLLDYTKIHIRELKYFISAKEDSRDFLYLSYGIIQFDSELDHIDCIYYNFKIFSKYRVRLAPNSGIQQQDIEFDVPRFSPLHFIIKNLFNRYSRIYGLPKSKNRDCELNHVYLLQKYRNSTQQSNLNNPKETEKSIVIENETEKEADKLLL